MRLPGTGVQPRSPRPARRPRPRPGQLDRRPVLAAGLALATAFALTGAGWPTDHGDNLRSGYAPSAARYSSLTKAFSVTLDGAVYASPILAGRALIVATENGTVYALDPLTGQGYWHRHLRDPVPQSQLPCGNINPLGITGTPAFDAVTARVFLVTESSNSTWGIHHEIFGLDARTGAIAVNRRIEVPGTDPVATQQRPALAVAGSNVYVAFGGLAGDCGNYKGAVVSLKTSGALGATTYVVPTSREGGIWAAGGPVVGPDGNVYVSVGNGAATSGSFDYSDSVTKLSPTMDRLDFFAPTGWAKDNSSDLDLGSMTPAFTADNYILQVGKGGTAYVLRPSALGGLGGEVSTRQACPAYGVAAVAGSTVFLPCTGGVARVEVTAAGQLLGAWTAHGIAGSPVVGPGAVYTVSGGALYALNPGTGAVLGSISVGSTNRFATPALIADKAYVGTLTGLFAVRV